MSLSKSLFSCNTEIKTYDDNKKAKVKYLKPFEDRSSGRKFHSLDTRMFSLEEFRWHSRSNFKSKEYLDTLKGTESMNLFHGGGEVLTFEEMIISRSMIKEEERFKAIIDPSGGGFDVFIRFILPTGTTLSFWTFQEVFHIYAPRFCSAPQSYGVRLIREHDKPDKLTIEMVIKDKAHPLCSEQFLKNFDKCTSKLHELVFGISHLSLDEPLLFLCVFILVDTLRMEKLKKYLSDTLKEVNISSCSVLALLFKKAYEVLEKPIMGKSRDKVEEEEEDEGEESSDDDDDDDFDSVFDDIDEPPKPEPVSGKEDDYLEKTKPRADAFSSSLVQILFDELLSFRKILLTRSNNEISELLRRSEDQDGTGLFFRTLQELGLLTRYLTARTPRGMRRVHRTPTCGISDVMWKFDGILEYYKTQKMKTKNDIIILLREGLTLADISMFKGVGREDILASCYDLGIPFRKMGHFQKNRRKRRRDRRRGNNPDDNQAFATSTSEISSATETTTGSQSTTTTTTTSFNNNDQSFCYKCQEYGFSICCKKCDELCWSLCSKCMRFYNGFHSMKHDCVNVKNPLEDPTLDPESLRPSKGKNQEDRKKIKENLDRLPPHLMYYSKLNELLDHLHKEIEVSRIFSQEEEEMKNNNFHTVDRIPPKSVTVRLGNLLEIRNIKRVHMMFRSHYFFKLFKVAKKYVKTKKQLEEEKKEEELKVEKMEEEGEEIEEEKIEDLGFKYDFSEPSSSTTPTKSNNNNNDDVTNINVHQKMTKEESEEKDKELRKGLYWLDDRKDVLVITPESETFFEEPEVFILFLEYFYRRKFDVKQFNLDPAFIRVGNTVNGYKTKLLRNTSKDVSVYSQLRSFLEFRPKPYQSTSTAKKEEEEEEESETKVEEEEGKKEKKKERGGGYSQYCRDNYELVEKELMKYGYSSIELDRGMEVKRELERRWRDEQLGRKSSDRSKNNNNFTSFSKLQTQQPQQQQKEDIEEQIRQRQQMQVGYKNEYSEHDFKKEGIREYSNKKLRYFDRMKRHKKRSLERKVYLKHQQQQQQRQQMNNQEENNINNDQPQQQQQRKEKEKERSSWQEEEEEFLTRMMKIHPYGNVFDPIESKRRINMDLVKLSLESRILSEEESRKAISILLKLLKFAKKWERKDKEIVEADLSNYTRFVFKQFSRLEMMNSIRRYYSRFTEEVHDFAMSYPEERNWMRSDAFVNVFTYMFSENKLHRGGMPVHDRMFRSSIRKVREKKKEEIRPQLGGGDGVERRRRRPEEEEEEEEEKDQERKQPPRF